MYTSVRFSCALSVHLIFSNEEDVTAVTDSNGNTLRIRRDTNRMPVRVVAPDNQVRRPGLFESGIREPLMLILLHLAVESGITELNTDY